jgi:hypothetical protein
MWCSPQIKSDHFTSLQTKPTTVLTSRSFLGECIQETWRTRGRRSGSPEAVSDSVFPPLSAASGRREKYGLASRGSCSLERNQRPSRRSDRPKSWGGTVGVSLLRNSQMAASCCRSSGQRSPETGCASGHIRDVPWKSAESQTAIFTRRDLFQYQPIVLSSEMARFWSIDRAIQMMTEGFEVFTWWQAH